MATLNVQAVPSNTSVTVQDANNLNVNVTTGNSINLELTPTPTQTIQISRGVAGNGIESVSIYYDGTTYYLDFLYTDGTNELVPLPSTAAGVTSFNTRIGAVTLTSSDVTTALGYTPPTPTGTGASGTWAISVSGNAATVTNGVVTTGTYADPLWITALAASKITGTLTNSQLANSSITINGTPVSLGGSVTTPQGTITSVTGTAPISSSGGTTPAISIAQANTSTSGFLSSTDWNTFNSKGTVTSVTATSPVTSTGGATPVIAMPAATTTVNGYLTATDWTTFNSKGNGTVTSVGGTGTVNGITLTGSITTSGNLTLGGTLGGIANSQLTNSSITINGSPISLGGSVTTPSGTVTSVAATAGTGISITGSPITTSGTLNITNTAPDQTVVLTAGTGINTSGTYPNFTITNSLPDQVVSLTGAGTTTVTGTYPSFTITSSGGGGGDVTGAASSTDNAITRFDGTTGKIIQNSVVTLDDSGNIIGVNSITDPDYITFNTAYATPLTAGQLGWDNTFNSLAYGMSGGNIIQHIGEDTYIYIKATAAITKGQVIMFTGSVGASGVLTGAPATGVTNGQAIIGVAAESIANNGFGYVQTFGELRNVNTSAFADGDILYYNSAVTGGFTATFPASGLIVTVAAVVNGGSAGGGVIQVRTAVTQRITASTGITVSQTSASTSVANSGVLGVTGTSPVASSGGQNPAISLSANYGDTLNPYASKTANFVLAAPNGTAGVPTFRAIVAADIPTLNQNTTGTAANVTGTVAIANGGTGATSAAAALTALGAYPSSNPSGYTSNTGTVTSVAALTLGTTGTDLSSTVATGTTTPVITLQVPTASATNRGALSSADWTTFNNKGNGTVTSVSGTGTISGITLSGTVTSSGNLTLGGSLDLSSGATGILPVLNGGTGVSTSTGSGSVVLSAAPTLTGSVTIGSTTGSSTITLGQSTGAETVNIATGINTSTKTLNIATNGTTGATNINIAPTGAGTSTSANHTINIGTLRRVTGGTPPTSNQTNINIGSISGTAPTGGATRIRIGSELNSQTILLGSNNVSNIVVSGTSSFSSSFTVGDVFDTSDITIGKVTDADQTLNIQAGALADTYTRTVNIGTNGLLGSTTNINLGSTAGSSTNTLNGTVNLSGLTASSSVATDASKNLVSVTNTGTGNNVLATSPTLTSPIMVGTITEDVFTITDTAGFAIDPDNGSIQLITLGASRTPTVANFVAGEAVTLMINDGTAFTITWTTIGVVWVGGVAPTLATTGFTVIELWRVNSTYYGAYVGTVA
jgi:hypothetical protein